MPLSTLLHSRHYKISPYTSNRLAVRHNWYVVNKEILYLLYLCCKRGGLQSIILDCYVQIVSCFFCLSSWLSQLWKPRRDVRKFPCKVLFLPDFHQTKEVLKNCSKSPQIRNFTEIRPVGIVLLHEGRMTDERVDTVSPSVRIAFF